MVVVVDRTAYLGEGDDDRGRRVCAVMERGCDNGDKNARFSN